MKKYKTFEELGIDREELIKDLKLIKEGKAKQKYEELDFSRTLAP
jgi:hypothetical protein